WAARSLWRSRAPSAAPQSCASTTWPSSGRPFESRASSGMSRTPRPRMRLARTPSSRAQRLSVEPLPTRRGRERSGAVFEGLLRLFQARPIGLIVRDLLDLFIVAYVIYRALLVLRGTRAMQMGIGLGIVFLIYWGAKYFGLVTLHNLLSSLLSSIILIVVVVF